MEKNGYAPPALEEEHLKKVGMAQTTMQTKSVIGELQFIISRFDHFFDTVNNKSSLYLSINTFILGGVIAGSATLDDKYHLQDWAFAFFLIPALCCCLVSFFYTLRAITPFTKRKTNASNPSLLFFGDINLTSQSQWDTRWESLTEEAWAADLQSQAKILACGLQSKFKSLRIATFFIGLQVAIITLFSIYYFIL